MADTSKKNDIFNTEAAFTKGFVELLALHTTTYAPEYEDWLLEQASKTESLKALSNMITQFAHKTNKKVVLLIDEVDQSSNNQLFVNFLAMLRNKYLQRNSFKTFHSVVLAGLHDVKSLKLKLRDGEEAKFNSPWNIAADFKVDMNLQVAEIQPMLDEYCADKKVKMADYLDRLALNEGYLIIFDHAKIKSWKNEWVTVNDKKVFAIWV